LFGRQSAVNRNNLPFLELFIITLLPAMHAIHSDALAISQVSYPSDSIMRTSHVFPYLSHDISSFLNDSRVVDRGLIISKHFSKSDIRFVPWNGTNLIMENVTVFGKQFFQVHGKSRDMGDGFTSSNLDYNGRYISLVAGNIQTAPQGERQLSFQITLEIKDKVYRLIFVNGPLSIYGWRENTYYERIDPFTSKLIDLYTMVPSSAKEQQPIHISRIDIIVQKNTTISSLEFMIYPGRVTENVPALIPGGIYFVQGTVIESPSRIKDWNYFLHDLAFNEAVTLEFANFPKDSRVVHNNWNIMSSSQSFGSSDPKPDKLVIKAERIVGLGDVSFFQVLQKFNIVRTIDSLDSKDFLLIIVLVLSFFAVYVGSVNGRQSIWKYHIR
jgi:hypothetical protein